MPTTRPAGRVRWTMRCSGPCWVTAALVVYPSSPVERLTMPGLVSLRSHSTSHAGGGRKEDAETLAQKRAEEEERRAALERVQGDAYIKEFVTETEALQDQMREHDTKVRDVYPSTRSLVKDLPPRGRPLARRSGIMLMLDSPCPSHHSCYRPPPATSRHACLRVTTVGFCSVRVTLRSSMWFRSSCPTKKLRLLGKLAI